VVSSIYKTQLRKFTDRVILATPHPSKRHYFVNLRIVRLFKRFEMIRGLSGQALYEAPIHHVPQF
jgi:hypothetical protein